MSLGARAAALLLILVSISAACASLVAPHPYQLQFRDHVSSPPSRQFPLGSDALGRDRLSRLIYATRTSLLLAPAAAALALATALAAASLALAGPRWLASLIFAAADLFLSLPWLFLLLAVRACLPLDAAPPLSSTLTFAVLGALGWAGPARVFRSAIAESLASPYVVAARARGISTARILARHVQPNLRPLLAAQFCSSVPVFILAEANLGLLGLGVSEPLPSWGSLLADLESRAGAWSHPLDEPWLLAPVVLLAAVVLSLRLVAPSQPKS